MKQFFLTILTVLLAVGPLRAADVETALQFVPGAAYWGMGAVGVPCRYNFAERTVIGATALVANTALTGVLKYSISSERPDGSDNHSFPSGHASRAFLGAELLRMDYGTWIGVGGYAVAIGVGALRVEHKRHRWIDVVGGAGIGIFSAHVGHWLLPFNRKWLGMNTDRGEAAAILPGYDVTASAVTLNAAVVF
jgi:membrane-associated phospholipid phosphatase